MWSGPRNISTAMMRSWGARADTVVCDEPLYAHYLWKTGLDHPGAAEVIGAGETDPAKVAEILTTPRPPAAIFYQKHMAHHLLPRMDTSWVDRLTSGFLIREPREMLTSLIDVIPSPEIEETGLPRQLELFEREADRLGRTPPVIDSRDVLENPRGVLAKLCAALSVPFDEAMLSWEPGPRETDGVWAKHWYASVEKSTGFGPYRRKDADVPPRLSGVLAECERLYERLARHKLTAEG